MSTIGTISVNLHTVDRDEVIYGRSTNTVSHTDVVALRRTAKAKAATPLRTNMRYERGLPIVGSTDGLEKAVTISIAATVPPGVDPAVVKAYISEALTQSATAMGDLAVSGDIHLPA